MSCRVLLSACPMCSEPVTFGGGMTMVKGLASRRSGRPALNAPLSSQIRDMRPSISAGWEVFSFMAMQSWLWNALESRQNAPSQHDRRVERRIKPDGVAERGPAIAPPRAEQGVSTDYVRFVSRLLPMLRDARVARSSA